jgi:DNA-binding PadR family transcriptional regulator
MAITQGLKLRGSPTELECNERGGGIPHLPPLLPFARLTIQSDSDITDSGMKHDPVAFLPLSPAAMHILLALAAEDLHGYGIMQEVTRQSEGRCKLGPGTLYDNLQRLLDQKLIVEVSRQKNDDPRRRYYRLSSIGKGVLAAEIDRLEAVFRKAKLNLFPARPRSA